MEHFSFEPLLSDPTTKGRRAQWDIYFIILLCPSRIRTLCRFVRGHRQKLAVASILSMEPDIIALDEPTIGQDRGHLNKFLARMKMLNDEGKTIILISHDMGMVAEYASRIIVMKDGGILMDPGTRDVFSRPDILEQASIEPHLLAWAVMMCEGQGAIFLCC